jgi:hypothetical protein
LGVGETLREQREASLEDFCRPRTIRAEHGMKIKSLHALPQPQVKGFSSPSVQIGIIAVQL